MGFAGPSGHGEPGQCRGQRLTVAGLFGEDHGLLVGRPGRPKVTAFPVDVGDTEQRLRSQGQAHAVPEPVVFHEHTGELRGGAVEFAERQQRGGPAAPRRQHQGNREGGVTVGHAQCAVQLGEYLAGLPPLDPLVRRARHREQPQQGVAHRTGGRTAAVRGRHDRGRGADRHAGVRITAAVQRVHGAPGEGLGLS